MWQRAGLAIALGAGLVLGFAPEGRPQGAEEGVTAKLGRRTTLPVPRFVSLKSNKVNVRKGPSADQAIVWVFSRAGLPVEIIAESENWRRVRDSEGADGWVFHGLLSGRRTVLVAPWLKGKESVPLYSRRSTGAATVAMLEANVLGHVLSCDGDWCEVSADDYSGFVEQEKLWGVYRDEVVK
jgi:SH3-like domain-containing protein